VFPDGVIDLLASPDICRPNLVFWDGHRTTIRRQIQHGGVTYEAPELEPSVARAIWLPSSVTDVGSSDNLFAELANIFEEYLGIEPEMARGLSGWNATTWLADFLPNPPALAIWAPDMSTAMIFFDLLRCTARRALILTGVDRSVLRTLPMALHPTLVLNQPTLSRDLWELFRASNFRSVSVPGRGGTILSCAGSKAIHFGSSTAPGPPSGEAWRVSLPPLESGLPVLDEQAMGRLRRFQERFQAYRLDRWKKGQGGGGRTAERNLLSAESEPAQSRCAYAQCDPELLRQVTPLLAAQQEEEKAPPEVRSQHDHHGTALGPSASRSRNQRKATHPGFKRGSSASRAEMGIPARKNGLDSARPRSRSPT
jgi:hypothetical protein